MDIKSKQIAYQVAFKAAVDYVSNGIISLDSDEFEIETAEVANRLYSVLEERLILLENVATPTAVAPTMPVAQAVPVTQDTTPFTPGPQPAGTVGPPWLLTDMVCPNCQAAGRNGMVKQNTDPGYKGPEFTCILKQRSRLPNGQYADTGVCDYSNWGRNAKQFDN